MKASKNFKFAPTHITLNIIETAFIIYGSNGICVGNLPTEISLKKF